MQLSQGRSASGKSTPPCVIQKEFNLGSYWYDRRLAPASGLFGRSVDTKRGLGRMRSRILKMDWNEGQRLGKVDENEKQSVRDGERESESEGDKA